MARPGSKFTQNHENDFYPNPRLPPGGYPLVLFTSGINDFELILSENFWTEGQPVFKEETNCRSGHLCIAGVNYRQDIGDPDVLVYELFRIDRGSVDAECGEAA